MVVLFVCCGFCFFFLLHSSGGKACWSQISVRDRIYTPSDISGPHYGFTVSWALHRGIKLNWIFFCNEDDSSNHLKKKKETNLEMGLGPRNV